MSSFPAWKAPVEPIVTRPEIITSLEQFDAKVLGDLRAHYESVDPIRIPLNSIVGYERTVPQAADEILTAETTSSASYTNLATTGPTLSPLAEGQYLFHFGATVGVTVGGGVTRDTLMSLSINGTTPSDNDACLWVIRSITGSDRWPGARATILELSGASNTVTAQYKVSGDTASFKNRWMIAVRLGS